MAKIMVECRDCRWRGRVPAHMVSVTPCPRCGRPLQKKEARGKKGRDTGFVSRG